jgi:hypothetical protein
VDEHGWEGTLDNWFDRLLHNSSRPARYFFGGRRRSSRWSGDPTLAPPHLSSREEKSREGGRKGRGLGAKVEGNPSLRWHQTVKYF